MTHDCISDKYREKTVSGSSSLSQCGCGDSNVTLPHVVNYFPGKPRPQKTGTPLEQLNVFFPLIIDVFRVILPTSLKPVDMPEYIFQGREHQATPYSTETKLLTTQGRFRTAFWVSLKLQRSGPTPGLSTSGRVRQVPTKGFAANALVA